MTVQIKTTRPMICQIIFDLIKKIKSNVSLMFNCSANQTRCVGSRSRSHAMMSDCFKKMVSGDSRHRFLVESIGLWLIVCLPVNAISLWFGLIAPKYDHSSSSANFTDTDEVIENVPLVHAAAL